MLAPSPPIQPRRDAPPSSVATRRTVASGRSLAASRAPNTTYPGSAAGRNELPQVGRDGGRGGRGAGARRKKGRRVRGGRATGNNGGTAKPRFKFLERKTKSVLPAASVRHKPVAPRSVVAASIKQHDRAFSARREAYLKQRERQREDEKESYLQAHYAAEKARSHRSTARRVERMKNLIGQMAPDIDVAGMQAHELLKADLRLERKAAERRSRMAARKYQKQLEKESSIAYQQRRVEAARTIQRCWGWYKGIRRMRKMHAAMELAKEQEIEREVQFAVDRVCNDVIKRDMEERAPLLATLQQLAETDRALMAQLTHTISIATASNGSWAVPWPTSPEPTEAPDDSDEVDRDWAAEGGAVRLYVRGLLDLLLDDAAMPRAIERVQAREAAWVGNSRHHERAAFEQEFGFGGQMHEGRREFAFQREARQRKEAAEQAVVEQERAARQRLLQAEETRKKTQRAERIRRDWVSEWDEMSTDGRDAAMTLQFTSDSWPRLPHGAETAIPYHELTVTERQLAASELGIVDEDQWYQLWHPLDLGALEAPAMFTEGLAAWAAGEYEAAALSLEKGCIDAGDTGDSELEAELQNVLTELRADMAKQQDVTLKQKMWTASAAVAKAKEQLTTHGDGTLEQRRRLELAVAIAIQKEAEAAMAARKYNDAQVAYQEGLVHAQHVLTDGKHEPLSDIVQVAQQLLNVLQHGRKQATKYANYVDQARRAWGAAHSISLASAVSEFVRGELRQASDESDEWGKRLDAAIEDLSEKTLHPDFSSLRQELTAAMPVASNPSKGQKKMRAISRAVLFEKKMHLQVTDSQEPKFTATARFPYQPPVGGEHEHDLNFEAGEEIEVMEDSIADMGPGWWLGKIGDRHGFFPSNFVEQATDGALEVVDRCANCERELAGRVDPDDDEFYCNECWQDFEEHEEEQEEEGLSEVHPAVAQQGAIPEPHVEFFDKCANCERELAGRMDPDHDEFYCNECWQEPEISVVWAASTGVVKTLKIARTTKRSIRRSKSQATCAECSHPLRRYCELHPEFALVGPVDDWECDGCHRILTHPAATFCCDTIQKCDYFLCHHCVGPAAAQADHPAATVVYSRRRDKLVASKLDKMPDFFISPRHPHPLQLLPRICASVEARAGIYSCDLCQRDGVGFVYHCEECDWDAHPICIHMPKKSIPFIEEDGVCANCAASGPGLHDETGREFYCTVCLDAVSLARPAKQPDDDESETARVIAEFEEEEQTRERQHMDELQQVLQGEPLQSLQHPLDPSQIVDKHSFTFLASAVVAKLLLLSEKDDPRSTNDDDDEDRPLPKPQILEKRWEELSAAQQATAASVLHCTPTSWPQLAGEGPTAVEWVELTDEQRNGARDLGIGRYWSVLLKQSDEHYVATTADILYIANNDTERQRKLERLSNLKGVGVRLALRMRSLGEEAFLREFMSHDVDKNGLINAEEFRSYLIAANEWERDPLYSDAEWDRSWPTLCALFGVSDHRAGISLAAFANYARAAAESTTAAESESEFESESVAVAETDDSTSTALGEQGAEGTEGPSPSSRDLDSHMSALRQSYRRKLLPSMDASNEQGSADEGEVEDAVVLPKTKASKPRQDPPALLLKRWGELSAPVKAVCGKLKFDEASWPQLPLDAETRVKFQDLEDHEQNAAHRLGIAEYWPVLAGIAEDTDDAGVPDTAPGSAELLIDHEMHTIAEGKGGEEPEQQPYAAVAFSRTKLFNWRLAKHTALMKHAEGQTALAATDWRAASWAFEGGIAALATAIPFHARGRLTGEGREEVGRILDKEEAEFKEEWGRKLEQGIIACDERKQEIRKAARELAIFLNPQNTKLRMIAKRLRKRRPPQAHAEEKFIEGKLCVAANQLGMARMAFNVALVQIERARMALNDHTERLCSECGLVDTGGQVDLETDEWYCLACWDNASDDTGDTDDTARGDDAPGTIQFRKIVPQPEPEPEEQPQVVDLCANCERRLPGRVDPDDEEFYCHECWLELEEELEASPEQRVQGTSVARIFHNASSDGSGVLSFNEFAFWWLQTQKEATGDTDSSHLVNMREKWAEVDQNQNGTLDLLEFNAVIEEMAVSEWEVEERVVVGGGDFYCRACWAEIETPADDDDGDGDGGEEWSLVALCGNCGRDRAGKVDPNSNDCVDGMESNYTMRIYTNSVTGDQRRSPPDRADAVEMFLARQGLNLAPHAEQDTTAVMDQNTDPEPEPELAPQPEPEPELEAEALSFELLHSGLVEYKATSMGRGKASKKLQKWAPAFASLCRGSLGGGTRLEIFGTEVECHALSKIREALVHTATHTRDDLDAMTVRELKQLARNMFTVGSDQIEELDEQEDIKAAAVGLVLSCREKLQSQMTVAPSHTVVLEGRSVEVATEIVKHARTTICVTASPSTDADGATPTQELRLRTETATAGNWTTAIDSATKQQQQQEEEGERDFPTDLLELGECAARAGCDLSAVSGDVALLSVGDFTSFITSTLRLPPTARQELLTQHARAQAALGPPLSVCIECGAETADGDMDDQGQFFCVSCWASEEQALAKQQAIAAELDAVTQRVREELQCTRQEIARRETAKAALLEAQSYAVQLQRERKLVVTAAPDTSEEEEEEEEDDGSGGSSAGQVSEEALQQQGQEQRAHTQVVKAMVEKAGLSLQQMGLATPV